MTYDEARKAIDAHVFKKFKAWISWGNVSEGVQLAEDKKVLLRLLPGLDGELFQLYLDKMFEDGHLRQDDGLTVYFTRKYVMSTGQRSYFFK